ncbi:unnamed protein product [Didymodactylos carnosus]|uniref:OTU domain-containing protein n=1 Tax=Didymodactylos carnosus TaxID=1234261 RepID=A0A815Z0M3_9BILA|nr:unnamed protein product [Didymodactylos carnosus]CAF1578396.1 unnamed protein product [Didymodactylos carnosus]CAF3946926.1 unnamed protein product [Didymodactylos carnosus]CAF4444883.1 unnamed protein product [Didymodactylos carnosus]
MSDPQSISQWKHRRSTTLPKSNEIYYITQYSYHISPQLEYPDIDNQMKQNQLAIVQVYGDGCGLFESIGEQIFSNPNQLRLQVVDYIKQNASRFSKFTSDNLATYIEKINQNKLGDYGCIVALAELCNITIIVHEHKKRPMYIQPSSGNNHPQVHIVYYLDQSHYDIVTSLNGEKLHITKEECR